MDDYGYIISHPTKPNHQRITLGRNDQVSKIPPYVPSPKIHKNPPNLLHIQPPDIVRMPAVPIPPIPANQASAILLHILHPPLPPLNLFMVFPVNTKPTNELGVKIQFHRQKFL